MNKMLKKNLKRIILILLYKITKPIDILFLFLFDKNICDMDKNVKNNHLCKSRVNLGCVASGHTSHVLNIIIYKPLFLFPY